MAAGGKRAYLRSVDYRDYLEGFRAHASFARITEFASVREGDRDYPLLRVETEGRRELVITSGFHGEEPAGPLTLLQNLAPIVEYARAREVALRIYPLINPSGFEVGSRYNRSGESPNNDFLRYEVAPGEWKGELHPGQTFLRWTLYDGGPKETRAVRADLERHGAPSAALDIHQDRYLEEPRTYAYTFGPHEAYAKLMEDSSRQVPVARGALVDEFNRTSPLGLIEYNDGSVTDYFLRRDVPFAAALETTTSTAMELCHRVNLIWIRGFIDLAAGARPI